MTSKFATWSPPRINRATAALSPLSSQKDQYWVDINQKHQPEIFARGVYSSPVHVHDGVGYSRAISQDCNWRLHRKCMQRCTGRSILAHYNDVIMTTVASQITSLRIVYSTVFSDADQRKNQSSASLAFVRGIHRDRWIPRTKGQLRGKFDDVIMWRGYICRITHFRFHYNATVNKQIK